MIIGIECELHSTRGGLNVLGVCKKEGLHLDRFVMKDGLMVKMSKDYYTSTIEYNFQPQEYSESYIEKVINFLQNQIAKYNLKTNCSGPGFVGTHVHIFGTEYRKLSVHNVLATTMDVITEEFNRLNRNDKVRLLTGHQIWGNYVHNYWSPEFHDMLYNLGLDMTYRSISAGNKKYRPVIISNRSNKGKPRSLEIRIIPNKILLNKNICKLLNRIRDNDLCTRDPFDYMSNWCDNF